MRSSTNPEDLAGMPLDTTTPAARYLVRYLTLLTQLDEADDDERLSAHIGTTLLDLIALALGASQGCGSLRTNARPSRCADAGRHCPHRRRVCRSGIFARRCGGGARRLRALCPGSAAGNRHVVFRACAGASAAAGTRHAGRPAQRPHEDRRRSPALAASTRFRISIAAFAGGLASPRRASAPTVPPGTRHVSAPCAAVQSGCVVGQPGR